MLSTIPFRNQLILIDDAIEIFEGDFDEFLHYAIVYLNQMVHPYFGNWQYLNEQIFHSIEISGIDLGFSDLFYLNIPSTFWSQTYFLPTIAPYENEDFDPLNPETLPHVPWEMLPFYQTVFNYYDVVDSNLDKDAPNLFRGFIGVPEMQNFRVTQSFIEELNIYGWDFVIPVNYHGFISADRDVVIERHILRFTMIENTFGQFGNSYQILRATLS
jgi:hypothetical protein